MSRAIVGRIFWKEIRVQRAFWFWILLLGAFVQFVPRLLGRDWYMSALSSQWFLSVNIVVSCCFAAGSAAIAFAGETEGRTKSLFQRMPLQTADLLVGKVGWILLGTYALFLLLTLSGALLGDGRTTYWSNDFAPRLDLAITWLMPVPFLVVGVLCSLVLRDVLTTVAVAGIATTVLMGSLAGEHRALFLLCFAVLAVVDVLVAPAWLKDASIAPWPAWLRRSGSAAASRGHSTFSVRSQSAWRRAASSLIWKEWHQAIGLTLTSAIAGAFVISLVTYFVWRHDSSFEMGIGSLLPGLLLALPLVFGVAAGHSDRRDGAFRLLAHRGVSPNAYWLTKHAVWLGLALATCCGMLGWEHAMSAVYPGVGRHGLPPLWDIARFTAHATFENDYVGTPQNSDGNTPAILAIVFFDVVMLYSIGALCAAIIPSTLSALVIAIIGWLGLCFYWTGAAALGLVAWWSLGILPLVFLFAAWVRTRDWLVDRNSLAAWGRAALSLALPLTAIAGTIVVYRVVQIPPVTLPLEVQQSLLPTTVAVHPPKRSLFVDAMLALTPRPPATDMSGRLTAADGWKYADEATRDFVAANGPARRLALQAVQQPPGDFPAEAWRGIVPNNDRGFAEYRNDRGFAEYRDRVADLAALLRDSARKLESENKLAEALDNYIAIARLGDDLARSNRVPVPFAAPDTAMLAMSAMDRWAAHPQQTVELIKRAISEFQRFEQAADFGSSRILAAWRAERQLYEDYVWKGQNPNPQNRTAAEMGFVRWCLPWELVRLQRVEDAVYARVLDETQLVERELHDRGFVDARLLSTGRRGAPWSWLDTTLRPPEEAVDGAWWNGHPQRAVNRAALARLHFLAWALAGYRREHQQLPEHLSALLPTYFAWLPVDPWTGSNFLYEPLGVPAPIYTDFGDHLQPLQPFVASAGRLGVRINVRQMTNGRVQVSTVDREGSPVATDSATTPLPAPAVAVPPLPGDELKLPRSDQRAPEAPPQKKPHAPSTTEKAPPVEAPPNNAPTGRAGIDLAKPSEKVAPAK
jgi:hypothetical protein